MGWTLELVWLGRTYTWDDVEAVLSESWDLWSFSPSDRSVSFDVVLEDDVSVAALVADGAPLDGAVGRLKLDGTTHLEGVIDSPRFGGAGHPLSFTISERPWEDSGLIPGSFDLAVVTAESRAAIAATDPARHVFDSLGRSIPIIAEVAGTLPWPTPETRDQGRVYPVVFGSPGDGSRPSTPAMMVDTTGGAEKLLIAGHPCNAGTVRVFGPNATGDLVSELRTITNERDGHGRQVCTVSLAGAATVDETNTGADWYIAWNGTATSLPGGAGDVLELVLRSSTLRVDWGAVSSIRPLLNRYQLAGYLDEQVSPWEWIVDNLLTILPIAPVVGPDGLYFALWDPDGPAVDSFAEGPEFVAERSMQYERMEPVNELTLHYRYRADTDSYTRVAVADPEVSPYAAISRQQYGVHALSVETDIVADDDTAHRIALDMVRARALRPLVLEGRALRSRYDHRRVGDLVTVTVPHLSLSGAPAFLTAIARDGGPMMDVEFALIQDPMRE